MTLSVTAVANGIFLANENGRAQDLQVNKGQYIVYDGVGLLLCVVDTVQQARQEQDDWCDRKY